MSADPNNQSAEENDDDPQSWNGYAYARNNPINLTDPDGCAYLVCLADQYGLQQCVTYANLRDLIDALGDSAFLAGGVEKGNVVVDIKGVPVVVGTYRYYVSDADHLNTVALTGALADYGLKTSVKEMAENDAWQLVGPLSDLALGRLNSWALKFAANSKALRIVISDARMTKILEAPTAGGVLNDGTKSIFNDVNEVRGLIQSAESVQPVVQGSGRLQFVVDAGRPIGWDRNTGMTTSVYTVITESDGRLVAAFPGKP
jgi:hypothetical protein